MGGFKDGYAQAALMGLGLYFVAIAVILVAIIIYDIAEVVFLLFFLAPGLIVGAALLFWQRWGLVVAIVGSAIGLLFLLEDFDLILTTPKAFFDFASTGFGVVGLLIVLIAALAGTVQYVRKRPSAALASWQYSAIVGVAAILAIAALFSIVLTALNTGSVSASDAEGAQRITAKHTKWDVEVVTVQAGDVKLVVKNRDPILHTFTIDDLDVDVKLGPWSEQVVVLEGLTAGNYGFICRVFDHETDMTGVITVQ
jgi:hypothetical protein